MKKTNIVFNIILILLLIGISLFAWLFIKNIERSKSVPAQQTVCDCACGGFTTV